MRTSRLRTLAVLTTAIFAGIGLTACGGNDGTCDTAALKPQLIAGVMGATPPRPKPPVVVPPKPVTPTKGTTTQNTSKVVPPPAKVTPPKAAPTPSNITTTPSKPKVVKVKPGKIKRHLKGEEAYYPVEIAQQPAENITAAQDAVRTQILGTGRFNKESKHTSPVTGHTYAYYSDDVYTSQVPQDLYDPFDPRNWKERFSPFYLPRFAIAGYAMTSSDNPLNGDYLEDLEPVNETPGTITSPAPLPSSAAGRNDC